MAEVPPDDGPPGAGTLVEPPPPASAPLPSSPGVPPPPPAALPPSPPRRFPRPRLLPWVGLLLLLGCLRALVWDAPRVDRPTSPGVRPEPRVDPPASGAGVQVVIDAGHGGADTGAVANGLAEKDLTLDLARRVAAALERRGVAIRLTRTDDRYVPLSTRARLANASPGAVFVSIHLNHASTGASGIETFYSARKEALPPLPLAPVSAGDRVWRWVVWLTGIGGAAGGGGNGAPAEPAANPSAPAAPVEEGFALAQRIQTAMVANTSAPDRGVKERSLYVTRHVRSPAVLVEGGFLSNGPEARRLGDPAYRQRLAESIAGAIVEYLRLPRRPAA